MNLTEYLETSIEVGIRIAIHDTTEIPFPDVFGFNAPTGYVSSFGVRLVSGHRYVLFVVNILSRNESIVLVLLLGTALMPNKAKILFIHITNIL